MQIYSLDRDEPLQDPLQDLHYTYDQLGNLQTIKDITKMGTFIVNLFASLICFFIALWFLIRAYRDSKELFLGKGTSEQATIINSITWGFSAGLIWMSIELFLKAFDMDNPWTIKSFLWSIGFSVIVGLIIFLGSIWGYFVMGKLRGLLLRKLTTKSDQEKSMTEQDHEDYAASSARHLANLIGTQVAGYLPDYAKDGQPPKLDLDVELFRNNTAIASLMILSALVKDKGRDSIIQILKPDHFSLFDRYLFEVMLEQLSEEGDINASKVKDRIPDYGPKYFNEPLDEHSLNGYNFTWAQILDMDPTPSQVDKAIELQLRRAKREGLIKEE